MLPKNLTVQMRLRLTADERELLETVHRVYGDQGVPMSLNDTLRHLIRRGAIVLPHTPDEATGSIRAHAETCKLCDFPSERYACPEGLYLYRNYRRVLRAHAGTA